MGNQFPDQFTPEQVSEMKKPQVGTSTGRLASKHPTFSVAPFHKVSSEKFTREAQQKAMADYVPIVESGRSSYSDMKANPPREAPKMSVPVNEYEQMSEQLRRTQVELCRIKQQLTEVSEDRACQSVDTKRLEYLEALARIKLVPDTFELLDNAVTFIANLNLQDQPLKIQREQKALVHKLMDRLRDRSKDTSEDFFGDTTRGKKP